MQQCREVILMLLIMAEYVAIRIIHQAASAIYWQVELLLQAQQLWGLALSLVFMG